MPPTAADQVGCVGSSSLWRAWPHTHVEVCAQSNARPEGLELDRRWLVPVLFLWVWPPSKASAVSVGRAFAHQEATDHVGDRT